MAGATLADGKPLGEIVRPEQGNVSRRLFADAEVYELELDRIFRRSWLFLAHESEVPEPGDYVTRQLGGEPVIVARGDDGEIRVFLNSCRHRGMRVCRADMDNASFFRCPYHGWAYRNTGELVGVPAEQDAYGEGGIDKTDLGLLAVPNVATYSGLVFGSWDRDAMPLTEFLGSMTFYLDLLLARSDGGMEVVGPPQRWDVPANWKFGSDNFIGDNYHTLTTHSHAVELGILPPDPKFAMYGHLVVNDHSHTMGCVGPPPEIPLPPYLGLPPEMFPEIERNLSSEQAQVLRSSNFIHGNVFPNLSLLNVMLGRDLKHPPTPFFTLRLWEPTGPTSMQVWSWFLVEKSAPSEYRQASYETYVRTFGPSGTFEQDDMENWVECTRANQGKIAQQFGLNHVMGIGVEPDPDWPGPGAAYPSSYGEWPQRAFYAEWLRWVNDSDGGVHD
jgi:nitrite reductase/ring-hydroxylating ferredoxin subunit